MYCQIGEREAAALARLFYAEYETCLRIRGFAERVLDAPLAARLRAIADGHEARFSALLAALRCERSFGEDTDAD